MLKHIKELKGSGASVAMGFGDFFSKAYKWVVDKAKTVATSVKDGASHAWDAAKDLTRKVTGAIKSGASTVGHVVSSAASEVYKGVKTVVGKGESVVSTVYQDVIQKPLGAIETTWANFSKGFSSPLTWLALGLGAVIIVPPLLSKV